MCIRDSIFDSKKEVSIHKELLDKWSNKVGIHDHVPVRNVIDIIKVLGLKEQERDFLFKSDFDYVLTEDNQYGKPFMIIEFDGLGYGYSSNGEYVQLEQTEDAYRKLKLDCKIKVCEKLGIPIVVISYPEIQKYNSSFSILDGIIGTVMADRDFERRYYYDRLLDEKLHGITDIEERRHIVEAHGIQLEIESKVKYIPFYSEAISLEKKLMESKTIQCPMGENHLLIDDQPAVEYFVTTNSGQTIKETVIMRDVNCSKHYFLSFAADMAKWLLLKKIVKR